MAAILIPTLILVAIVLFSSDGDIVKNFYFPDIFGPFPTTSMEKQEKSPQLPSQTSQTQIKQAPLSISSPASEQLLEFKVSPYLGKIKVSELTPPTKSLSSSFTLIPKLKEGQKINITGWYFETTIGQYTIPQGVKILKGGVNTSIRENIVLESGQKLILSTGRNPDEGFSENDWYVYIEGEEFLREVHDRVTLRDQNGFFVDQKIY